ncbi:MFS transporter [Xanthomonas axonopodis pv. poinsettiicola]|uniref:MFS transporter n=1 Tax=Xanthomonas TaxID=338 RepID=UPI001E42755A|nr:MFS transporter [Xanthomonas codiaei]MCC8536608.1 MFS transporter [Xanthomonas codiaei]
MRPLFTENARSRLALVVIIVAQLFGTSLWFSVNSAADDLMRHWGTGPASIGLLTIATQIGFIVGTISFALSGLADRFSPNSIFASCALAGAACNAGFAAFASDVTTGMTWRFLVGLGLSGIYPIGMKLVVSWAPQHASKALAWLVGMLTLGTALPQGIKAVGTSLPWQMPILVASGLALLAAVMILRLGQGSSRLAGSAPRLPYGAVFQAFSIKEFRASTLGYFGHMWELYAMWTLVPILVTKARLPEALGIGAPALSFLIISAGAIGCILGGQLSSRYGSARVAAAALLLSALCCLTFPLVGAWSAPIALAVMLVWGGSVVADSPQFSALSARACPTPMIGSALSMQNAIGFAITVAAIGLTTRLVDDLGLTIAWILLPGPLFGLVGLMPLWRNRAEPQGC